MTRRAKSMALNCAALVSLSVAGRAAEAQSNTFPTTLQVDEHRLQKVPAVFKFQARISQAKIPVGEAQFNKVIVNLVKGTQTLCVEEFTAVKVRDSVLNLELGRGMSCSLENVIAENNGLKFQVCLNGTENCLKPIDLAAVPYAVKSSFAATSQAAHTADISGQAYYTHRATADRDMLLRGELGVGYFDFETPASASKLYSDTDFVPYANNGFISWAPVSTEHPRLTVCSRDVVTGAPQPLEELVLHAAQTSMKGAAAIDSDAHVGGKLQVDGASTLRGGLTIADAPGTDWDLDCQGGARVTGKIELGSKPTDDEPTLIILSNTKFEGKVSFEGELKSTHTHLGSEITTPVAAAGAVPWSGVADKPSTFPPSGHSHGGNEITGAVEYAYSAWNAKNAGYASYAGSAGGTPPVGSLTAFAGNSISDWRWKLCDGSALNRNDYPSLFEAIGYTYGGSGDYFNLPDLRGRFVRGADWSRGVGSFQDWSTGMPRNQFAADWQTLSHTHGYKDTVFRGTDKYCGGGEFVGSNQFFANWAWGNVYDCQAQRSVNSVSQGHNHAIRGGDSETRPANIAVNWIIKVAD